MAKDRGARIDYEAESKRLERELGCPMDAEAMSSYAVCVALVEGERAHALGLATAALARDRENPEIWLNLARVLIISGDKRRGRRVLVKALRITPGHREMAALLRSFGVRRRPPLGFLKRDNALNRLLGRITARFDRDIKISVSLERRRMGGPAGGAGHVA